MNGQIAEWRVARAFSLQLPAARQRRVLRLMESITSQFLPLMGASCQRGKLR